MKKVILLAVAVFAMMTAQAQRHVEFKWHRWYGVAGYDFSTNINKTRFEDKATFHGVYAIGGWQIRKESGVGLGVEFLKDPTGAFNQLPVFVELRSHYLRSQLTPYTSVSVGYSIPLGSSSGGENAIKIKRGGAIWGVNVGARYAITRTFAVSAFVGYQGIFMGSVERKIEGLLANNGPLLLHNLKAGVGFNF